MTNLQRLIVLLERDNHPIAHDLRLAEQAERETTFHRCAASFATPTRVHPLSGGFESFDFLHRERTPSRIPPDE